MSTTTDKDKEVSGTGDGGGDLVDDLIVMGFDADEVECLRGNHPDDPQERYEEYVRGWLSSHTIPEWARGDVRLFSPGSGLFGAVLGESTGSNAEVVTVVSSAAGLAESQVESMPLLFCSLTDDYYTALLPHGDGLRLLVVSSTGDTHYQTIQTTRIDWLSEPSKQAQWLPRFSKTLYTMFFEDDDEFADEDALRSDLAFRFECVYDVFKSDSSGVYEWFRSPVSDGLVSSTETVDAVHTDDGYEHRVTLTAPAESGLAPGTKATLTFDGSAWGTKSAEAVRSEYLKQFATELELSDEMAVQLYSSWDEKKTVRTPADLARETLVDAFTDAMNSVSVTAAEALESWEADSPAGILFTEDGEDFIAVGSRWARDLLRDEERELSRPLEEVLRDAGLVREIGRATGPLYAALRDAEHVGNPQASVFIVPIGKTAQDADAIRAVEDMDGDLPIEP
jgi:hypothetical protein